MRRRRHRVLKLLAGLVLIGGVTLVILDQNHSWIGCGVQAVRVRGVLVEADTRQPIGEAWVMALPDASWASKRETVEMYREIGAEFRAGRRAGQIAGHYAPMCGSGHVEANGAFEFLCGLPYSSSGGPFGVKSRSPAKADDIQALLVEVAGRAPVVVAIQGGEWTPERREHRGSGPREGTEADYAILDLGRIEVRR